jgi:hypothetical protein
LLTTNGRVVIPAPSPYDNGVARPKLNNTRFHRIATLVATPLSILLLSRTPAEEPQPSGDKRAASAATKVASPDDIQTWIAQLGDDAFPMRQAAASRLLAAGLPARDALVAVAEGPDPELRAAARRLVALIDRTEFNRRLEAFASDTEGKRGLTLPGWDQFRKLVGSDAPARALFVEMQRAEGPLIAAAFGVSSQPPGQLWEERITRLVTFQFINGNRTVSPPLGSCAAMLFLGAVPEIDVSDRGADLVENLIQRPPINEALSAGTTQEVVRRLVVAWLLHCPNNSEATIASRLQLMSAFNLKGGLPLALAVASGEKEYADFSAPIRAWAVLVVGRFGAPEHAQHLEPLLEDARVCATHQVAQPNQPMPSVQVRDVALCVMLQLTGQKPADYGYLHARLPPQQIFDVRSLQAASDDVRVEAAAKWKEWRESEKGRETLKGRGSRVESREPDASETKAGP